ncbi:anthrone oxygenase family protein [Arthrobacter pascens]|uniref:anthrone oxygenase family protein n=1 Tax=Arthrobacter pascens TaxID=1677 RepID=UPI00196A9CD0|nr:anthrone oxygenase family protein [Arthrobacter pascens]MBN3498155.1 DUF1772 domain-containing protein [Arthrobacter pascens]
MSGWLPAAAGTGSALVGGFYLAFSAVVMPALRRRPGGEAVETMAVINENAVRPPFTVLFFGTAAACAAVLVEAAIDPRAQSPLRVAGAAAYLAGWASTMLINVPLNNRLSQGGTGLERRWLSYERPWTKANHLRAALSIAGAAGLLAPTI